MAKRKSLTTPANIRPFFKYSVNVITDTRNTTINIFCNGTISPDLSQEWALKRWELKASAVFVSILPEGRTDAVLICQNHHQSMDSNNEANHLTLLPFLEILGRHRVDLTAHVYISNSETPWLGEWFKRTGVTFQNSAVISQCMNALEEPLMTLDLRTLGIPNPERPEFSQLGFKKLKPDPSAPGRQEITWDWWHGLSLLPHKPWDG